jgi:putative oxidoreductase
MDHVRGVMLSLFRVVAGLLFVCHGVTKLFNVLGGPPGGTPPRFGDWPLWWAGLIELVTGVLIIAGLATRVAALLASGEMAFAYFTVHAPRHLFPIVNQGELAVLFCWSFLLLALFGGGPWSLDELMTSIRGRLRARGTAGA